MTPKQKANQKFTTSKKRAKIVFVFFIIWSIVLILILFNFAVLSRDKYLKMGQNIALREGIIIANRGKILDSDGKVLSWSQRYYDLNINKQPVSKKRKKALFIALKKIFPKLIEKKMTTRTSIKRNITPITIKKIGHLSSKFPELSITPRFRRTTIDYPQVRKLLGKASYSNGIWKGQNGLEEDYNDYLNGKNGIYTVMLDKYGRWIKGTWKLKREMKNGKDLHLALKLDDILKNKI